MSWFELVNAGRKTSCRLPPRGPPFVRGGSLDRGPSFVRGSVETGRRGWRRWYRKPMTVAGRIALASAQPSRSISASGSALKA